MFSGGEDCVFKLRVKWSELLSQRSMTSEAVRVHGLDWFLQLDSICEDIEPSLGLHLSIGFKQIPPDTLCCATQVQYTIDPNGAKYTIDGATDAVCDLKSHHVHCLTQQIGPLLNDGWLTVVAKLHIFKPVHFSPILPSHFVHSFSAPAECVHSVAERNGLIYLLTKTKHSNVTEEIEQWTVQCMKAFDKESTVTLGLIRVKPEAFVGSTMNIGSSRIAVTQVDIQDATIQLDVIDLSGVNVYTRMYTLPPPHEGMDNSFWDWPAANTSQGWMMSERVRQGTSVGFQFWLLADDMTVFSQVRVQFYSFDEYPSIANNALYCAFVSRKNMCQGCLQWHIFVCHFDDPSVWNQYRLCPSLGAADVTFLHWWPEPVLAVRMRTSTGHRFFLFGLEFTTTDCLLVPFVALPHLPSVPRVEDSCFNDDSLLFLEEERNELRLIHLRVPRLKTLALLRVQRMLGEQWKDKLQKINLLHLVLTY